MKTTEKTLKSPGATQKHKPRRGLAKLAVLILVIALAVGAYARFGDSLTLENLAAKESALRTSQDERPVLIAAVALLAYAVATGLSLPGAAVLTLVFGWYFGFWQGTLIVSFASTAGATLAFLFSRFLLRDSIQEKFGDRIAAFNRALESEGAFYLFTLRLIPVVPFFVINLVMGLTPMRTWTFWWVSQVGMLAGTAVYVYAGSSVPSLAVLAEKGVQGILSPQLLAAFVLLGIFPLLVKKIVARLQSRTQVPS